MGNPPDYEDYRVTSAGRKHFDSVLQEMKEGDLHHLERDQTSKQYIWPASLRAAVRRGRIEMVDKWTFRKL